MLRLRRSGQLSRTPSGRRAGTRTTSDPLGSGTCDTCDGPGVSGSRNDPAEAFAAGWGLVAATVRDRVARLDDRLRLAAKQEFQDVDIGPGEPRHLAETPKPSRHPVLPCVSCRCILDALRARFEHVESFLMDRITLRAFKSLWGTEDRPIHRDLPRLTAEERALYRGACTLRRSPRPSHRPQPPLGAGAHRVRVGGVGVRGSRGDLNDRQLRASGIPRSRWPTRCRCAVAVSQWTASLCGCFDSGGMCSLRGSYQTTDRLLGLVGSFIDNAKILPHGNDHMLKRALALGIFNVQIPRPLQVGDESCKTDDQLPFRQHRCNPCLVTDLGDFCLFNPVIVVGFGGDFQKSGNTFILFSNRQTRY